MEPKPRRAPNKLNGPPSPPNKLKGDAHRKRNGWREGYDPIQRGLRVITTMVVLGVFVYLAVDPSRPTNGGDFPTLALALGAVLILLGYESIVKLPGITKGRKEDDDE